jgi:hypothetical protein
MLFAIGLLSQLFPQTFWFWDINAFPLRLATYPPTDEETACSFLSVA